MIPTLEGWTSAGAVAGEEEVSQGGEILEEAEPRAVTKGEAREMAEMTPTPKISKGRGKEAPRVGLA